MRMGFYILIELLLWYLISLILGICLSDPFLGGLDNSKDKGESSSSFSSSFLLFSGFLHSFNHAYSSTIPSRSLMLLHVYTLLMVFSSFSIHSNLDFFELNFLGSFNFLLSLVVVEIFFLLASFFCLGFFLTRIDWATFLLIL